MYSHTVLRTLQQVFHTPIFNILLVLLLADAWRMILKLIGQISSSSFVPLFKCALRFDQTCANVAPGFITWSQTLSQNPNQTSETYSSPRWITTPLKKFLASIALLHQSILIWSGQVVYVICRDALGLFMFESLEIWNSRYVQNEARDIRPTDQH